MKKLLMGLAFMVFIMSGNVTAQSFSTEFDTVSATVIGSDHFNNRINNLTTSTISIGWKIIANNFPADWQSLTGFCDNFVCYTGASVFSGGTQSADYPPGFGTFYMVIDLTTATTLGTFYVNVQVSVPLETPIIQTYIITKTTTSVSIVKAENNILVYPNPVKNELTVAYNETDNVKSISLVDINGKIVNSFSANSVGNYTNVNVAAIPAGLYYIQLINSKSEAITVKKFVKQ